ncbi:MAG: tetratricopeptide repeat protein [Planctomycetes bacterium]|nr:tetratricopeptide repeat protein [Planctomycetota bacterium]
MKHFHLLFGALLASCASSAPELQSNGLNEVRHLSADEVERMESVDIDEWNSARSNILRTFAFRALENNLVEEAREYLTEACELNPEDTACHAALARLFLTEGQVGKALSYAERAIAVAPDNPEINMVYAAALAEAGQIDKASQTLENTWQAIESDPSFARVILTHYAATGQTEQAQDFVGKMLKEDPNHARSWTTSGDLMLSQGDLNGAAEAYRTALKINPEITMPESIRISLNEVAGGTDPMFSAAQRSQEDGDYDSAINLLRFLVEREPQNQTFLLAAAQVYWAQNNTAQAQNFLGRVAITQRDWRGHILQAKLDIINKRYTQARTALLMASRDRDGIRSIELLTQFVDARIATAANNTATL